MLRALLVLLTILSVGAYEPDGQTASEIPATITRVECVSPEVVEIEVTSAELFPVRNAIIELHVGSVVSGLSRYMESGDLHTIIFLLTPAEFQQISPSDIAMVGFNPGFDFQRWVPIRWTTAKVHADCHLQVEHARYSVPYRYVGYRRDVRLSRSTVEIRRL